MLKYENALLNVDVVERVDWEHPTHVGDGDVPLKTN